MGNDGISHRTVSTLPGDCEQFVLSKQFIVMYS